MPTTGDVIWVYRSHGCRRTCSQCAPNRTLALYGDQVFLATADAALVALDARTGAEVWRTVKADYAEGFRQNAGPVIAERRSSSPARTAASATRCRPASLPGHNPDTGEELWRTSTIALPGDPNDASWGDTPPYLRAGRRRVDSGELRRGARSLLRRDGAGEAVGGGVAAG